MSAPRIYAEELRRLGHGEPLWFPEPDTSPGRQNFIEDREYGREENILIGDVGYFDRGGNFKRLFNALCDKDHPVNRGQVPVGFRPLTYDKSRFLTRRPNYCAAIPMFSRSISRVSVAATVAAAAHAGLSYAFKCTQEQGALAVPGSPPTSWVVHNCEAFRRYMLEHWLSWFAFAEAADVALDKEDIVLVNGWVKTDSWALAAVHSGGASHALALATQDVPLADISVSVDIAEGVDASPSYRLSARPDEHNKKLDQCLFVRYYKMQRRLGFLPRRPIAQAEPQDYDRWNDTESSAAVRVEDESGGEDYEAIEMPETVSERNDPLDACMEYILSNSPATSAIVSHDDLYRVLPPAEWPDNSDIVSALKVARPLIVVDENGVGYFLPPEQLVFSDTQPADTQPDEVQDVAMELHTYWSEGEGDTSGYSSTSPLPEWPSAKPRADMTAPRNGSPSTSGSSTPNSAKKRGQPRKDHSKKRSGVKKEPRSGSGSRSRAGKTVTLAAQRENARRKRARSSSPTRPSLAGNQLLHSPPTVLRVESLTSIGPVPVTYAVTSPVEPQPLLTMPGPHQQMLSPPLMGFGQSGGYALGPASGSSAADAYRPYSAPPTLPSGSEPAGASSSRYTLDPR